MSPGQLGVKHYVYTQVFQFAYTPASMQHHTQIFQGTQPFSWNSPETTLHWITVYHASYYQESTYSQSPIVTIGCH